MCLHNSLSLHESTHIGLRGSECVALPNFVKIGQTVAVSEFTDGGRQPYWSVKNRFFMVDRPLINSQTAS